MRSSPGENEVVYYLYTYFEHTGDPDGRSLCGYFAVSFKTSANASGIE
jgi:hypothetical protein